MPRVKVKICGLKEEEHLLAAARAGVDYLGMVFAPSKRRVSPERAELLSRAIRGIDECPALVGVFVNESIDVVNAISERCGLDLVQLSGDENSDYCEKMERPIIKTLHVYPESTAGDIQRQMAAISRGGAVDVITYLLDTGDAGLRGGTGLPFDWRVAREISALRPVIVAGGLTPATVGGLVQDVRPFGVDVSSGVERQGRKDTALLQAFVDAVRKAEQEMDNADNSAA
jgi:phosphoribosylanthranilate isomerase